MLFMKLKIICFSISLFKDATSDCTYKSKYYIDTPVSHFKNIHSNVFKDKQLEKYYNVSTMWEWIKYFSYQLPCGTMVNDPSSAIQGGKDAPEKSWPWQVRVGVHRLYCGGVLIDAEWVLTAAHCLEGQQKLYHVILGTRFNEAPSDAVLKFIKVIAPFEEYDTHFLDHDIALVKMESKVTFSDKIKPVCLPISRQDFTMNDYCYITGFGDWVNSRYLPILQQLRVYVVPDIECSYLWRLNSDRTDWRTICAGRVRKEGGGGVCFGDSGGPLSCKSFHRYYVAGLTKRSPKDCTSNIVPDQFTKVSEYINWILYTVDKYRDI